MNFLFTWFRSSIIFASVALLSTMVGRFSFADYPTSSYSKSQPGRPILSVPVDPFMTARDEAKILEVLKRPADIQWADTSPEYLAKQLAALLPVTVNRRALEDVGIEISMPLTLEGIPGNRPLGANLIAMFKAQNLSFVIRGGRFEITTDEDAESEESLVTRIYDVTPLASKMVDDKPIVDCLELMNSVETTISPSDWESLGGPSTMICNIVRDRVLLSITTTSLNQLEIQAYLDNLNFGSDVAPFQYLTLPRYGTITGNGDYFFPRYPTGMGGGMMRIEDTASGSNDRLDIAR